MTKPCIKFDDLNNCALLDLFDMLNLEELVNLANLSPRVREIITKYYGINKFRLHEKTLQIGFQGIPLTRNVKKMEYNEFTIKIYDMATAIRYLRNFGHLTQHIIVYNIDYHQQRSWTQNIIEYINEYCSESLRELELMFYGTFNNTWKKPFTKLTKIEFGGKCYWIDSLNNINSSEIFPLLSEIYIGKIELNSSICLANNFPHLEYVHLDRIDSNFDEDSFRKFFEMNPQIRSLKLNYVNSLAFLYLVDKMLPNLEHLDMTVGKDVLRETELGDVHFKNVKNCSVDFDYQHSKYIPIIFDQAEELAFHKFFPDELSFVEFMTKNHNVKFLNLLSGGFSLEQWMLIVENMPNLVKIQKWWGLTIENDFIFGLMATETNLKTVILFTKENEDCTTFWRRLVDSQWQVECERGSSNNIITFTRDHNNL